MLLLFYNFITVNFYKFNSFQKPVIEQIRAEVKRLNLAKEQQESLDDAKKNNESVDDEKDEEMSTVDNSETSFNDKTSQSCDISINKSPNSPGINLTNNSNISIKLNCLQANKRKFMNSITICFVTPAHQHDNSPCSGVSGDNEKSPGDTSDFDDKSIENGEKPLAIFKGLLQTLTTCGSLINCPKFKITRFSPEM